MHGCTGKGNDQLRFELAFRANYPGVKVIAPLRDKVWTRDEEIEYALARGIPVSSSKSSPFSFDENLFGRSIEAGILEDPWEAPPEEPYLFTADPDTAPEPVEIVIGFEGGLPVSIDGEAFSLVDLIAQLNRQAGAYGIGRIDMIENRAIGIKSREVYEAPAAMTLITAHRALEDMVLTRAELTRQARHRGRLGPDRLRRALVLARPRGARRLRRQDAGACHRRRSAPAAARRRDRQRAAVRERALRRDARLVRDRRDVPARGRRGLHPARLARGRAGGGEGANGHGMTLWAGRVEVRLAPEVWDFLRAQDAELFPYDCEGDARCMPGAALRRSALRRRVRRGRAAGHARTALPSSRRRKTSTRRSSGRSARWGGGSTPAGHGTTRSSRRCGSTSWTRARRRWRRSARSRSGCSTSPTRRRTPSCRGTRTSSAPSRSRSATTCSRGPRCSSATGRGSGSQRSGRGRARSAPARSPGRPCRCRRRRARCGTRSTRLPTATSRSTTSTRRPSCSSTSPGSARSSCSGRRPSSGSRASPRRRRPARR